MLNIFGTIRRHFYSFSWCHVLTGDQAFGKAIFSVRSLVNYSEESLREKAGHCDWSTSFLGVHVIEFLNQDVDYDTWQLLCCCFHIWTAIKQDCFFYGRYVTLYDFMVIKLRFLRVEILRKLRPQNSATKLLNKTGSNS